MYLRPTGIARRLLGLDAVLNVDTQGDTLAGFRLPGSDGPALDALGDGFLGVGFAQRLAPGKPLLAGGAKRHEFAPPDFIALPLHEP